MYVELVTLVAVVDLENEPSHEIGHRLGSRRENHIEDQQRPLVRLCLKIRNRRLTQKYQR